MTTNMLASNPSQQMPWRPTTTLSAVLLCFIAIALAGMLIPTATRLITWIVSLVLLASIVLIVGRGVTGRWFGFLIDERNKMSLSRFQAVLWSLLILSAFLAAALINLHLKLLSSPTDALAITIPAELLALLGISGTSLVGAQLILHAKSQKLEQIATHLAANQADWYDMFKGDDAANAAYLDLSKLQMFYSTIILVLVYGFALAGMFMGGDPKSLAITAFPSLSATMVTLLGISHAGYLLYKAVPRAQTTAQPGTS